MKITKTAANTIKSADVHMGRLTDVNDAMSALMPETVKTSAIELVILLKRAEDALAKFRANVADQANTEFLQLVADNPSLKEFDMGLAVLKRYTPRGDWQYPPQVIAAINAAEQAKAYAQQDGTAVKTAGELKPGSNMFTVTLKAGELGCDPR